MIIEITQRWPFVRRHQCAAPPPAATPSGSTPAHAHRSWVRTKRGLGWIHHHENDGYVIEFPEGDIAKCQILEHVEAPR